ncbi:SpaA isopeptide-forming pilin-related protein [Facklamia sp. P9177]|uniref:SpaA isopeptide-forming pilin-related protein n=1 Tax=Facklamia sp. P9177 TaxID=3421945 RepID=UPI003D178734
MKKYSQTLWNTMLVLLLLLSTIPFKTFTTAYAQEAIDPNILQLKNNPSTWQIFLNSNNNMEPSDQLIMFETDAEFEQVHSFKLITNQEETISMRLVNQQSDFNRAIKNFMQYREEMEAYQQDKVHYEEKYQTYLEAKKQNDLEWQAYQEALETYQLEYANYEQELEAYWTQYNQLIESGLEIPSDLVEPQAPSQADLVEPEVFTMEEPLAPENPYNEEKEKLWQVGFKANANEEVYQFWIPKAYFKHTLQAEVDRSDSMSKSFTVKAVTLFSNRKITAQQTVPKNDDNNKELATNEESTTVTIVDDNATTINQENKESSQEDHTKDKSTQLNPEPILKDEILVQVDQPLLAENVVENYSDLSKEVLYEWEEAIDTSQTGVFQTILSITFPDGETIKLPVEYEVIARFSNIQARSATDSTTPVSNKFNILALDQFDNPAPNVEVKLFHYNRTEEDWFTFDLSLVNDDSQPTSYTGTNGYTAYYNVPRDGSYPYFYVKLISTPNGYAPPKIGLLEKNPSLVANKFDPKEGSYYGAYNLSANGTLSPDYNNIYRPFAKNGREVLNNAALIRLEILLTDLTFKKVDQETQQPLANAVYRLSKEGDPSFSQTVISNQEGKLDFTKLSYGSYELKEINAPDGYLESEKTILFDIDQNEDKSAVFARNFRQSYKGSVTSLGDTPPILENKPNRLRIRKVNKQGDLLEDAQFTLKTLNGTVIPKETSNSSAIFEYSRLSEGSYLLTEDKAPIGYYLPHNNKWTLVVDADGKIRLQGNTSNISEINSTDDSQSFNLINQEHTLDFKFTKIGLNESRLAGAQFDLKQTQPFEAEIASVTTDSSGEVQFEDLGVGSYELIETKTPPGYVKQHLKTLFDLELLADNSGLIIKNIQTINLDTQKEVAPLLKRNPVSNLYEYTNTRESYSFFKVDEKGKPLSGAQFRVVNDAKTEEVLIKTSDTKGRVTLNRTATQPNSTFTIQEIRAPLGYQKSQATWKITTDEFGQVTMEPPTGSDEFTGSSVVDGAEDQIKMTNKLLTYTIQFTKVGLNDLPLEGAKFTLTPVIKNDQGEYIEDSNQTALIAQSAADGTVIFNDLPLGFYRLQEIQAPPGYVAQSDAYDIIEIKLDTLDNKYIADILPEYNQLLTGDDNQGYTVSNLVDSNFKIVKYGYSEKGEELDPFTQPVIPLAGVQFELKGIEGKDYLQTATTNATGTAGFTDVETGKYELRELSSPNTHLRSNNVYQIEIVSDAGGIRPHITRIEGTDEEDFLTKDDSGKYRLDFAINRQNPTNIQLKKVADDNEGLSIESMPPLEGASFQIYEYDRQKQERVGQALATKVTGADGLLAFKNLPVGKTYEVVETQSPVNYETISGGGISAKVEVSDKGELTWLSQSDAHWNFESSDGIPRVINRFHPIEIEFWKRDDINNQNGDYGNAIAGASFTLTRMEGDPASGLSSSHESWTVTSDTNGRVSFNQELSNYRPIRTEENYVYFHLDESFVPDGYRKIVKPVIIQVDRSNNVSIMPDDLIKNENAIVLDANKGYVVINELIRTDFSFNKIDGEDPTTRITGSIFRLKSKAEDNKDHRLIDQVVSQNNYNSIVFKDLPLGKYLLYEEKAPAGYKLLGQPLTIEIIESTDSQGNKTGQAEFILDEKQVDFISKRDTSSDGNDNEIVVMNYQSHDLILTGGTGVLIYLVSGFILMALTSFYYLQSKKTHEKE